eukprot:38731_1
MSSLQTKYTKEKGKALQWCQKITEWYNMNKSAVHSWFKYCINEGYCDTNGVETEFNGVKLIKAELKNIDQCDFLDVDPNFPLPAGINPTQRDKIIFYVLRYCYDYNNAPTIQNVTKNINKKIDILLPVHENKEMSEEYGSYIDYINIIQTKEFKLNPNARIFIAVHSTKTTTEPVIDDQKMDKPYALKKKRKKKPKPKRYSDGCEVYDPHTEKRAKGIIQISR